METKNILRPFELKKIEENGIFEGYGSVWGVLDWYRDIIVKGAFANSLAAHKLAGTMPALCWQHDSAKIPGVWLEMVEDDYGLFCRGRLLKDDVQLGREAYALLKAGALRGLSVGINTKLSEYDNKTDVRIIKEAELWETSIVTWAANGLAMVDKVKSVKTVTDLEKLLRDALGLSRKAARDAVHTMKATLREASGGDDEEDVFAVQRQIEKNIAIMRG